MRHTRVLGLAAAAALLTGCSAPVAIDDPAPTGEVAQICTEILSDLPAELLGSASRDTTTAWARAWGDPPITIVCGTPEPAGLTPTSQCLEVNGVGWWEQAGDRGTVWTTIGRPAVLSVGVPDEYGDPVAPLAQLSTPIAEHNPAHTPCVQ